MKRTFLAVLIFPLSAMASGPFTAIHPEEHLPDPQEQASADPFTDYIGQVQQKLRERGFDAGPVNGDFGFKTQAALAQFQLSLNIPASGQLDAETLDALEVQRPTGT
jgi:peptidoglycan hydrolase-like protein with peptidoglycan-binding domain